MENDNPRQQLNSDVKKWFEALDQLNSEPFFPGRPQPITPERQIFD